jgi:hypothetical protein
LSEEFPALLPALADEEPFVRVEKKIARGRRRLSAVPCF